MFENTVLDNLLNGAILIFSTFVTYSGLIGPWHVISIETNYKGCTLPAGFIMNPYFSEICGVPLADLEDDGGPWQTLKNVVGFTFAISFIMLVAYNFKAISHWKNYAYVALVLNAALCLMYLITIAAFNSTEKPAGASGSFSLILMAFTLVILLIRVGFITYKIYLEKQKTSGRVRVLPDEL